MTLWIDDDDPAPTLYEIVADDWPAWIGLIVLVLFLLWGATI